uniref:Uncharacterized protein n=1 Tax=Oryza punctata TaxID=4537 RepID=A0A0E0M1P9_ORYPU
MRISFFTTSPHRRWRRSPEARDRGPLREARTLLEDTSPQRAPIAVAIPVDAAASLPLRLRVQLRQCANKSCRQDEH